MSTGKELRLRRIIRPDTGRCILFALSHGTSTVEIFAELDRTPQLLDDALGGGADCILISNGFAAANREIFGRYPSKGLVTKVSSTAYEDVPYEMPILSVEQALHSGADAVGILMQLTPSTERAVISMISSCGEQCERYGVPLIVEAELPGAYSPGAWFPDEVVPYLRRACRMAQEFGADIIKTNWPGSAEAFAEIIAPVSKPVVVAGGSKVSEEELLGFIRGAIEAGAVGCSVGRNIFKASDPRAMTARIAEVVHGDARVPVGA